MQSGLPTAGPAAHLRGVCLQASAMQLAAPPTRPPPLTQLPILTLEELLGEDPAGPHRPELLVLAGTSFC